MGRLRKRSVPVKLEGPSLPHLCCRFGKVESLRKRSVPVKLDGKKMPRRAAVLTGNVSTDRRTANAYVVFAEEGSVDRALASNMQQAGRRLCACCLPVSCAKISCGAPSAAAAVQQADKSFRHLTSPRFPLPEALHLCLFSQSLYAG